MLGWFNRLASWLTRPVKAGYDNARNTTENKNHWANADALSVNAGLTPEIRANLRNRSRYEVANNCYAAGVVSTLALDTVGSGPKLQVQHPSKTVNAAIETAWRQWAKAAKLADKLRVLDESRHRDGECFSVFGTNPLLLETNPIRLDLKLIETDQVADPWLGLNSRSYWDGIDLDQFGNPSTYSILRNHPGEPVFPNSLQADKVDASQVIHWYRATRPGQLRGVPALTPALGLFAQLRRFTLATLMAAETAAMFAGVMETNDPAVDPDDIALSTFSTQRLERGTLLTLPAGYKASQFRPEQPTTQYQAFVSAILREIGRCLNMPFGLIAGDSSSYNYSSARLDHQTYEMRLKVDREQFALRVLDVIFLKWLEEAVLIDGLIPSGIGVLSELPHTWHFDKRPSIDPAKEANADDTRLKNRTITYAEIFASRGQDWEEQMSQMAREDARMEELGLKRLDMPSPTDSEDPSTEEKPTENQNAV